MRVQDHAELQVASADQHSLLITKGDFLSTDAHQTRLGLACPHAESDGVGHHLAEVREQRVVGVLVNVHHVLCRAMLAEGGVVPIQGQRAWEQLWHHRVVRDERRQGAELLREALHRHREVEVWIC